jgi:hypothetical protein
MKWALSDNPPQEGDIKFKTRFSFLPTTVLNNSTEKYQTIWLRFYVEEQEYNYYETHNHCGYKWFISTKIIDR